jgi:nicotinamide-nucleotide amidase
MESPLRPPPDSIRFPGVELVCTGTELLSGRTLNTHAQFLGGRLGGIGLPLQRETVVPDAAPDIEEAVRSALGRAEVVVVTGGLGPTSDDLTRDVLAKIAGRAIRTDEPALENIRARCARAGRDMTASRARQALVLDGAEVLPNPVGMAPGEWIEHEGRVLIALPGPPREFQAVLDQEVLPRLRRRFPDAVVLEAIFHLCGIAESDFVDALQAAGFHPEHVAFACCAAPARLDVRLRGPMDAADELARTADCVRRTAGRHLVCESALPLETVVVQRLTELRKTVAVAESCTGGLVGGRITAVPGSSAVFAGGVIAYSNEVKIRDLGVRESTLAQWGSVSEETAREMAEGARRRFATDFGLSVTGIAGPGGGSDAKPLGLVWLALASGGPTQVESFRGTGERDVVREASVQMALDLLRRAL